MHYVGGNKKDRQYGKLDQIRTDHVRRYLMAANIIPAGYKTLDLACGCGYGSWLLHSAGIDVTAADVSPEALEYAVRNYPGPRYTLRSAEEMRGCYDAFVTFETLEHIPDPLALLLNVRANILIASVPNEERYPFKKEDYAGESYPHLRHYTVQEFEKLLSDGGYKVENMCCQKDKDGLVQAGTDGKFLIAIARGQSISQR